MRSSSKSATTWNTASSVAYAFLPCNVAKKPLKDWIKEWEAKYPAQKKYVLAIGAAAADALTFSSDTFARSLFINPKLGPEYQVAKGQEIYFAGTDLDANYRDMDKLYVACKQNGASFEYRIVRGGSSELYNLDKSIQSIKYYITH